MSRQDVKFSLSVVFPPEMFTVARHQVERNWGLGLENTYNSLLGLLPFSQAFAHGNLPNK